MPNEWRDSRENSYSQPQTLNLANGCWYKGTIMHEFMHAMGKFFYINLSDKQIYGVS